MTLGLRGLLLGAPHALLVDGAQFLELALPALLFLLVHLEDDRLVLLERLTEQGNLAVLLFQERLELDDARVGGGGRPVGRVAVVAVAAVKVLVDRAGRLLPRPLQAPVVVRVAEDGPDAPVLDHRRRRVVPALEGRRQERGAAAVAARARVEQGLGRDGGQPGPAAPAPVARRHAVARRVERVVRAEQQAALALEARRLVVRLVARQGRSVGAENERGVDE